MADRAKMGFLKQINEMSVPDEKGPRENKARGLNI